MRRAIVGGAVLAFLLAIAPAQAQGQYPEEQWLTGRFHWNIGGTLAIPVGDSADRTDLGGGFTAGVTFVPRPQYGIQLEYGANWAGLKTGNLAGAGIGGNSLLQYFNLNAAVIPLRSGPTSVYLLGGGGLYYRAVDVTRYEGTGFAPYCDPFLYFCYTVPVDAVTVLGSRSRWDWGLDAGLGMTFAISPPIRLYVEVRYHYVFGPTFTDANGNSRSVDTQLVPVTLGFRF